MIQSFVYVSIGFVTFFSVQNKKEQKIKKYIIFIN